MLALVLTTALATVPGPAATVPPAQCNPSATCMTLNQASMPCSMPSMAHKPSPKLDTQRPDASLYRENNDHR